jgi:hypothetical protein
MRRRLAAAGIVVLAATSLAAPAAAAPSPAAALLAGVTRVGSRPSPLSQAAGPFGLPRGFRVAELRLTNHDGYSVTVTAYGQTVALSVSSPGAGGGDLGSRSTTTYLAHGRVTPTSIRASFADRGRIAVRFRPSGREMRASRKAGCHQPSRDVLSDLGFFVGELRFEGEGSYTSVEAHHVRGRSIHFAALLSCLLPSRLRHDGFPPTAASPTFARLRDARLDPPAVPTHPSRGPQRTTLFADLELPLSRTVFAARVQGHGGARFAAVEEASEGPIGVIRSVDVRGPRSAFTFERSLAGASVVPPAPFHGRGELARGLGGERSWTGSLAVSFLGAPRVALTGAPFRTFLVQSWRRPARPQASGDR